MFKFLKMLFEAAANGVKGLAYLAYQASKIFIGIPCAVAWTFVGGTIAFGLSVVAGSMGHMTRGKGGKKGLESDSGVKAVSDGIFSSIGSLWGWSTSPVTDTMAHLGKIPVDCERVVVDGAEGISRDSIKATSDSSSPIKNTPTNRDESGKGISSTGAKKLLESLGKGKPRG